MAIEDEARLRLKRPDSYHDTDRKCDVVMKGGITSGVVYPLAVCELATSYRFKNVGGTSAGAIVAATTAAAELGRQTGAPGRAPGSGFAGLAAMADWLGAEGNLTGLFQPNRPTSRLHRFVMAAMHKPRRPGRILAALMAVALRGGFARWTLAGLLPGALLVAAMQRGPGGHAWIGLGLAVGLLALVYALTAWKKGRRVTAVLAVAAVAIGVALLMVPDQGHWASWGLAVAWLVLLLGAAAGLTASVLRHALRVIPGNDYGLTTGRPDEPSADQPALSDFLHSQLNTLAGLDPDGPPLVFGQLWAGRDRSWSEMDEDEREAAACAPDVNLEMLTTCVTQGRPYRMPGDFGRRFFFRPAELRRFVPDAAVDHMVAHPADPGDSEDLWNRAAALEMAPLPAPGDLPVVLTTRMSLSFPVLISAVPLYAVDYSDMRDAAGEPVEDRDQAVPQKVWFSDGGITSNFPVSFFDSLLPRWPTFGINLRPFHPRRTQVADEACNLYLPSTNLGGIEEWWTTWDDTSPGALPAFLGSIVKTMQNWVDNAQMRVPGFRDRVVHVSHSKTEGGLNLDMPPDVVERLSERGRHAGARIVRYYTVEPEDDTAPDDCTHPDHQTTASRKVSWSNHRWVRLRSTLGLLEGVLLGLRRAYSDDADGGHPYRTDLHTTRTGGESAREGMRKAPSYSWDTRAQRELAIALMDGTGDDAGPGGLVALGDQVAAAVSANASLRRDDPRPEPRLQVMPGHTGVCDESRPGPAGEPG